MNKHQLMLLTKLENTIKELKALNNEKEAQHFIEAFGLHQVGTERKNKIIKLYTDFKINLAYISLVCSVSKTSICRIVKEAGHSRYVKV